MPVICNGRTYKGKCKRYASRQCKLNTKPKEKQMSKSLCCEMDKFMFIIMVLGRSCIWDSSLN